MCVAKNGSVTWATLLNVDLVVRSHRSWAWTHDEVRQVSTYAPGRSSEGHAPFGHLRGLGAMYLAACPASDSGEPWRDAMLRRAKRSDGAGHRAAAPQSRSPW